MSPGSGKGRAAHMPVTTTSILKLDSLTSIGCAISRTSIEMRLPKGWHAFSSQLRSFSARWVRLPEVRRRRLLAHGRRALDVPGMLPPDVGGPPRHARRRPDKISVLVAAEGAAGLLPGRVHLPLHRRTSASRGLLFYRLLQQCTNTDPAPLKDLIIPRGTGRKIPGNPGIFLHQLTELQVRGLLGAAVPSAGPMLVNWPLLMIEKLSGSKTTPTAALPVSCRGIEVTLAQAVRLLPDAQSIIHFSRRQCCHTVGAMFWFSRNRLVGSYSFFSATSRR